MTGWLEDLLLIDSLVLKQETNSDQPRVSKGNRSYLSNDDVARNSFESDMIVGLAGSNHVWVRGTRGEAARVQPEH